MCSFTQSSLYYDHRVALYMYIYYIYIELACAQSPFFQNLPYECTASVPDINKKGPVFFTYL